MRQKFRLKRDINLHFNWYSEKTKIRFIKTRVTEEKRKKRFWGIFFEKIKNNINTYASGWSLWRPIGVKLHFVGECIVELNAYFIVIILNFIFKLFIKIKIGEKRFHALKNSYSISDFKLSQKFAHYKIISSIFISLKNIAIFWLEMIKQAPSVQHKKRQFNTNKRQFNTINNIKKKLLCWTYRCVELPLSVELTGCGTDAFCWTNGVLNWRIFWAEIEWSLCWSEEYSDRGILVLGTTQFLIIKNLKPRQRSG